MQIRQILDLVLIANEVIEEYISKKKEGIIFKVDFEKEYDHIGWEFLRLCFGEERFWVQVEKVDQRMFVIGKFFGYC